MHRSSVLASLVTVALVAAMSATPLPALAEAATSAVEAPSGTYVLDRPHGSITFRVRHLGLSFFTARSTDFDAVVSFDADRPERSSVTVNIRPASIRTDYPTPERTDFDKEFSTDARWFDTAKYPQATFVSKDVRRSGPQSFAVTGDLTIRGITKSVVLDTTMSSLKAHPYSKRPMLGFSARTHVRRSDFGMTYLLPDMVADDVELIIETEFGNRPQQP